MRTSQDCCIPTPSPLSPESPTPTATDLVSWPCRPPQRLRWCRCHLHILYLVYGMDSNKWTTVFKIKNLQEFYCTMLPAFRYCGATFLITNITLQLGTKNPLFAPPFIVLMPVNLLFEQIVHSHPLHEIVSSWSMGWITRPQIPWSVWHFPSEYRHLINISRIGFFEETIDQKK